MVSPSLVMFKLLLLLGVATASPVFETRQTAYGDKSTLLRQNTTEAITSWMQQASVNGMTVVITTPDRDEILSFGKSDNRGRKVTEETYWAIASNSKLMAGLTLAMLQERNVTLANGNAYTLDTPLVDVVEGFKMWDDEITQSITTRDFLMHVSGLPPHLFALAPSLTPSDWLHLLPSLETTHPLRTQWDYSNMNYVIASAIVERLTNTSFYDVVQEYLWDPLGVEGATWNAEEARSSDGGRSFGWLPTPGGQEAFQFWTEGEGEELAAAGSALMRGIDILQWAKALVNPSPDSPITSNILSILAEQSIEIIPGSGINYGIAEFIVPFRGFPAVYHDGGIPGSYSSFHRVVDEKTAVIAVCNDEAVGPYFAPAIARTVLAEVLGLEYLDEISAVLPPPSSKRDIDESTPPGHPITTTPLSGKRPPPAGLAGTTYSAPAYGEITLYPFTIDNATSVSEAAFPLEKLTVDLASSLGEDLRVDGQNYYAHWNRSISSHLIFTHWDGPLFNVTSMLVLNKAPDAREEGEERYVAITYGTGPAVCVDSEEETGVGIFGGFLGAFGAGLEEYTVVEKGVKEASDLFFTRI